MAELSQAVRACDIDRGATSACAAVVGAVHTLADQANSLAAPQEEDDVDGAGDGGAAQETAAADVGAGPPDLGTATHSLVLLTDGEATDEDTTAFDAAAALLRDPPFEAGGFKALLVS